MVAYFDSSVPLAILLDEATKAEAYQFWSAAETRVSSVLLRIETTIVLRRTYEHNKRKLPSEWLTRKTAELEGFLEEVNYRLVDEEIEQSITRKKDLAKCRALDALHLATALEFSKLVRPEEFCLFSYDSALLALARHYKLSVNSTKAVS